MNRWVAVDVETTGLVPGVHHVWEVAAVEDTGREHVWLIDDVNVKSADPGALQVGRFYDRWAMSVPRDRHAGHAVAAQLATLTAGAHLVAVNPAFDAAHLDKLLRAHNRAPAWHYHLVDVGAMAYGWLHGNKAVYEHWESVDPGVPDFERRLPLGLPWRSDELSRACGVQPPSEEERHTALGDARWAARWYRHLIGEVAS